MLFWSISTNMLGMIERLFEIIIQENLLQVPALALLGSRQIGKTTLAKKIASNLNSTYLDLESPDDQLKLIDPLSYFAQHADRLVILDEIQRQPELFSTLRSVIDRGIQQGRKTAQFLLLGSASADLLRQSSESLAGRIRYLEMGGINVLEIEKNLASKLWLRGGFPKVYLAPTDSEAMNRLEDLIRAYLERDIPQMGFKVPANRLRRLWTMLAHLQGETINCSKLATNLEVDSKTVSFYLDILTDLLLLRRLNPWYENVKKRLVKSPRYYIRDSGILHRLLGIENYEALLSSPVLGKSWEGFVIENIHSVLPHRAETYFYRTAAGAEIDLVIKLPSSEIWAIEVKYGLAPKPTKNFSQIGGEIGAQKRFIVYGGSEEFPIGNNVSFISLPLLMRKLLTIE